MPTHRCAVIIANVGTASTHLDGAKGNFNGNYSDISDEDGINCGSHQHSPEWRRRVCLHIVHSAAAVYTHNIYISHGVCLAPIQIYYTDSKTSAIWSHIAHLWSHIAHLWSHIAHLLSHAAEGHFLIRHEF